MDVEARTPAMPMRGPSLLREKVDEHKTELSICAGIGLVLLLILLPLSFSYIEYYEYGLLQRKSTGTVDTSEVYLNGRHFVGPDYTFKKYQADAHFVQLDELGVFSAGATNSSVGLEFFMDITATYLIIKDEVGVLHEELASGYAAVVEARMKEGIKNAAVNIEFNEYFQEREHVVTVLAAAVQARLSAAPSVHVKLDRFLLGRVQIPETVAQKQLDVKIQNERNDMESNLKKAQLERDLTDVEVNKINLQKDSVTRIANANAVLTREQGIAQAKVIVDRAYYEGYANLFSRVNITSGSHKASLDYLRTLSRRANDTELSVTYLDARYVAHVTPS